MRIFLITFFMSIFFTSPSTSQESFYDLNLKSIDDKNINFSSFKGKFVLIVNVASKCGFTPQYKALEELYNEYKDNLVVIGVPCNQFGGQEPNSQSEIKEFCSANFGVSFLLSEKIKVKGSQQHPLYKWLTNKNLNMVSNSTVQWNFQKYLINEKGEFVNYWYSFTKPLSEKITKYLK